MNFIKSQKKDYCGVAPLEVDNTVINDSSAKAQVLNEYFSSVFTPVTVEDLPEIHDQPKPDINPIIVEINGVLELLRALDIHKANGPDGIPAHLLKETCAKIAPSITVIFQASMQQCVLPIDWKAANVVPLFKKGDRAVASNYRPVSLTCICSKLLEHIIYSHIYAHLTKYSILYNQQHGVCQGQSNAFAKSSKITSVCSFLFKFSAKSLTVNSS